MSRSPRLAMIPLRVTDPRSETTNSTEQVLRLRERFVELARVLAAAAGVVGFAATFAADDGRDGLNDFPGLDFRGEVG